MKIYRILVGTAGGAVITGLCFAGISWIVIFNSNPGFGVEGPHPEWATLAAVISGVMGFILGLPLGLLNSLINDGKIVGTFLGLLAGLVALVWGSQMGGHPDIVYPTVPLIISFIPAGGLSGFLTSLLVTQWSREDPAETTPNTN